LLELVGDGPIVISIGRRTKAGKLEAHAACAVARAAGLISFDLETACFFNSREFYMEKPVGKRKWPTTLLWITGRHGRFLACVDLHWDDARPDRRRCAHFQRASLRLNGRGVWV
jgi:hypothetical protein